MDVRPTVDPYVKITYDGKSQKTKVIKKENNPTFTHTMVWDGAERGKIITFEVWDWDTITRNDLIGSYRQATDLLVDNETKLLDLELLGAKEQGRLYVNIRFIRIPPGDMNEHKYEDPENIPPNPTNPTDDS